MGCCVDGGRPKRTRLTKEEQEERKIKREEEAKLDLNEMFEQFDINGNGSLDKKELSQMVKQLSRERGNDLSEEEAQKYVQHILTKTKARGDRVTK